jgi:hypothetical protein
MHWMILASVAVLAGTTAIAQTGERSLLDANKFWTPGGSEQTSKIVKDPAISGGKAIETVSTGKNSKYSANVSYRLTSAYQQGEIITVSGTGRALKSTTLTIAVSLVDAPYTEVGSDSFALGTDWTPFRVQFPAASSQKAGVTRVSVQLNGEARTVAFGPLKVTAAPAR